MRGECMEWLRFSSLAIGFFPTGVLMCVLTIFLLTIKKKSLATWMLILYYLVLSILLLSYIVRHSVLSSFGSHTGQASNLILFGIAFYMLFAYLFLGNPYIVESKIVCTLFSTAALAVYISIFVQYAGLKQIYDFQAHYYTYLYGVRVGLMVGLGYLWIIIIFLRKMVRVSEYHGRLKGTSIAGRFLIAVVKTVLPRGRDARPFLAMALLTAGMFSISFMYLLMSAEIIGRETYGLFFNAVGLLTTFSIFLVFTNSTFEPSSFRWKLIGLSLAPAMLILGIVSIFILSDSDSSFDKARLLETDRIKTMLTQNDIEDLPPHIAYITSRPDKGLFSRSYRIVYSRGDTLNNTDFIRNDLMDRERTITTAVSDIMKGDYITDSAQVRKLVGIDIDSSAPPLLQRRFRYFSLIDPSSFYMHYDFRFNNRVYEVGYSYTWYRRTVHIMAVKLLYIIIGTGIVILVLFPLFFYRNLFKIDFKIY
jgi:hypothetical protein